MSDGFDDDAYKAAVKGLEFIGDLTARMAAATRRCHRDGEVRWDNLAYGMGRNELPDLLDMVWSRLPHDQLLKGLENAWTMAEFPERFMPRRHWLPIFEAAGYHENTSPAEPPASITLWRGGTKRTGMSWTADRAQAEWFRDRPHYSTPGKLWTVTVGPDRLLAHYHSGRGEDEYVINPAGLRPREIQGGQS